MAWQIHTSFHTSGGAVSGCNGFNCSLVGRAIISNLISNERAPSIGFQFNLPSFFARLIFLQLEERCERCHSSNHRLCHSSVQISASPTVLRQRNPSKTLKKTAVPNLFISKPLSSLHPSLSPLSSHRLLALYSPQNPPHPPPTVFYSGLSLKADIIYRRSSCKLISQHKSLSPVHPSLTRHPILLPLCLQQAFQPLTPF